ncbi:DUF4159 domain-containing protein [bacterium]|nr:DUF4159 domain-containing protein [bacterium]
MNRSSYTLLSFCLLASFAAAPLCAADDEGVTIARLRYGGGGDWYCDPGSLANWLAEFERRTGVPAADGPVVVSLDSEDLYRYPMLYVSGHGRIALDEGEVRELRRYLEGGGFLYADDNYGLDASFRELMAQVFPDDPLAPLGSEHSIYHCFYDLPGLPKIHEHDGEPAQGFGIARDGRLMVFYSWSSDIGDGLEAPQVHGDPPAAREAAARMAVNILMYALTHP